MPIILNKNDGVTEYTVNNFENIHITNDSVVDKFLDIAGTDETATLVKFSGTDVKLTFSYNIIDGGANSVSGSGSPISSARAEVAYIHYTFVSTGTAAMSDKYRIVLQWSTTPLDANTATGGSTTTMTDGTRTWTVNAYTNQVLKITGGTGSGQIRRIVSNTATVLTIDSNDPFVTAPDNTSTYQILDGFMKRGTISKMEISMDKDAPLSFRCDGEFFVGTTV